MCYNPHRLKQSFFMEKRAYSRKERATLADRVTVLSVFVNVVLFLAKMAAGIFGRSQAMVADAMHTLSDFTTDFVVLIGMRFSRKPEDSTYCYGHGRYETLAAVLVGVTLAGVGVAIGWEALVKIWKALVYGALPERPGMIAFWAALISIAMKEGLFQVTFRIGKATENTAVIANAWHHRSDALSSIGTALGIGGAVLLGGRWVLLDPVAALVVSVILTAVAIQIVRAEFVILMDGALPQEAVDEITQIALSIPDIKEPHRLRTRKVGNVVVIDAHFRVDPEMRVWESHLLATRFEDALRQRFGQETISTIHVEPEKKEE